jgi:hypothetical protein
MAENYKYYPHGDKDFTGSKRHDNKVLVREGSRWRNAGDFESWYSPEDLLKIRQDIEAGFGKIQKINEAGQIVQGGRADLMRWTKGLEKKGGRR